VASQPIDEGGQSQGATEILGAPEYFYQSFDCEYLEHSKSQHYLSIRA